MSTNLRLPRASPVDRGRTASPSGSGARSPSRPPRPWASLSSPDAALCARLQNDFARLLSGSSSSGSRSSFDKKMSFERTRSAGDDGWDVSEDWGDLEPSPASSGPSAQPSHPYSFSALSHDASLLALATSQKFLLLRVSGSSKNIKDPDASREFTVVAQGSGCQHGETITAMSLVGVYKRSGSKSRSPNVQMFLAVGYSSGFLRIFSDTGDLLLSQPLHRRHLVKISLRFLPRAALDDQEELFCLFEDRKAVVIEGLGLMTALRMSEGGEEVPLLAFRKIWFQGQETISDAISVGPSANTFYPSLPSSGPPPPSFTARFLAVGTKPMLAYHCTSDREGFSLTNVASKVTSALGSIANSFFGRKPKEESRPDPASELAGAPARPVPTVLFLSDTSRKLTSVVPAPIGGLAAVTDNLGRVLLLDLDEGEVIRMWKGSRGAQVGWIEVLVDEKEKPSRDDSREQLDTVPARSPSPSRRQRSVLLLAIYLPRGVLEIHRMRHGGRLAQIAVPPNLRLLQNSHGALVLNQGGFKRTDNPAECFLLAPTGEVRAIRVPVCSVE